MHLIDDDWVHYPDVRLISLLYVVHGDNAGAHRTVNPLATLRDVLRSKSKCPRLPSSQLILHGPRRGDEICPLVRRFLQCEKVALE